MHNERRQKRKTLDVTSCTFCKGLLVGDHVSMSANAAHVYTSAPVRKTFCLHSKLPQQGCRLRCIHRSPGSATTPLNSTRACISASANSANMTDVSTPHSGYHYNGAKRRFFEGWYFKVSLAKTSSFLQCDRMQAVQCKGCACNPALFDIPV